MDVTSLACPLFVPIVEEGWMNKDFARLAVREYLTALKDHGIDAIVLDCTHYPLLRRAIESEFPSFTLVDSSVEIADAVTAMIQERDAASAGPGSVRILVTDVTEQVSDLKRLFFPHPVETIEEVVVPELHG
jgi:glutamate racemase